MPGSSLASAPQILAERLVQGKTLLLVPHMDDAVLACGGIIALLSQTIPFTIVYATDGRGSPEPIIAGKHQVSANLSEIRATEARTALSSLGIDHTNVHFLNLPDGALKNQQITLSERVMAIGDELKPKTILAPFRYDRHPDHLAVYAVAKRLQDKLGTTCSLVEYFVYHKWRLLPGGDVRNYIRPAYLQYVDTSSVAKRKRQALSCFKSQTTIFYDWQTRPNLTAELLDNIASEPEFFVSAAEKVPGKAIFEGPVPWIRVAHRLEPYLKKKKDRWVARWRSSNK